MKLPFIKKPYHLRDYKFSLVILVLALSCLGVLVIGSANRPYQSRQILGLVLGIIVMVVVSLIDYIWIMNFYWILYFLSVFMLAIVLDQSWIYEFSAFRDGKNTLDYFLR